MCTEGALRTPNENVPRQQNARSSKTYSSPDAITGPQNRLREPPIYRSIYGRFPEPTPISQNNPLRKETPLSPPSPQYLSK